jgi:hypothetical protein
MPSGFGSANQRRRHFSVDDVPDCPDQTARAPLSPTWTADTVVPTDTPMATTAMAIVDTRAAVERVSPEGFRARIRNHTHCPAATTNKPMAQGRS